MLGHSGAVDAEDIPTPTAPSPEHPVAPGDQVGEVIPKLDESVETPPQRDPSFPYRVKIYVGDRPRESSFLGNDEYVPLDRGDVYKIVVENRTDRQVYLRLLVDGLNTLPEPVPGEAETDGQATAVYRPAQRVSLDEAQAWRLEPCPPEAQAKRYTIRGFYRRFGTSKDGEAEYEWETFKVVDAIESLAYQQGYTEQIGLITAAFYGVPPKEKPPEEPRPRGPGGVGTAGGEKERGRLDEYQKTPVGDLRGVINVHYVEPEALKSLTDKKAASRE
jgi:hypothetical protein